MNVAKQLEGCCQTTTDTHSRCNRMVICSGCKQTLKYFTSRSEFERYAKFCRTRGRQIQVFDTEDVIVVRFGQFDGITSTSPNLRH
jgi:hypothetical protein